MSIGTTSRSLLKTAKNRFPGAADSDLEEFVLLQFRTALKHKSRGTKDDDLLKLADDAFEAAVQAGEEWAVSLKNSYRDNVIRPLVDKAREKGVDPVPVIVMQTDLSEAEANAMIEALDAASGDEIELDEFSGDDSFNTTNDSVVTAA